MTSSDATAAEGGESGTPPTMTINVGTRRSALALRQAEMIVADLERAHAHQVSSGRLRFAIHGMATAGDVDKTTPLPALGKGLWTTELEARLASGELDMVVHCVKDMPTTLPAGCAIGCVTEREDPRDVVIFRSSGSSTATEEGQQQQTKQKKTLADLPAGSVVGTSSVRRAAQLRRRYPGLRFLDVRGNIDTRLRKLDDPAGPYDCIILAAAGLLRMDMGARIAQFLGSDSYSPPASATGGAADGSSNDVDDGAGVLYAVGQGALCIEVREGDERVLSLLRPLVHRPTLLACWAERSVMRALEGGCSVPIGVESAWLPNSDDESAADGEKKRTLLRLQATVVSLDGTRGVDGDLTAVVETEEQADEFGKRMAQDLIAKGAQEILDAINRNRPAGAGAGAVKVGDGE